MLKKSSAVNKNLIVISIVSTFLIFLLSSIFWFGAYTQRSDATRLQISTQPEDTLFKLAQKLAQERALLHTLLAEEKPSSGKLDLFYEVSADSKQLMLTAVEEIRFARQSKTSLTNHQYSDQSIERLIFNLTDGFERISQSASILYLQIAELPLHRDEGMRMQWFDAYGNLIRQVNNLRLRTQFLPSKHYPEVVSAHSLKSTVWDLSESLEQINSLIDGYIVKHQNKSLGNINRDGMLFRIYQQIQTTDDALFQFREMSEANDAVPRLKSQITSLSEGIESNYQPIMKELIQSIASKKSWSQPVEVWQEKSNATRVDISRLANSTIQQTLYTAHSIGKSATFTLLLYSLLVLGCIGMAIASTRIAKRVQHQATHDDLTGLPNRRYFTQNIQESITKAERTQDQLTLMTIDLNRFKTINDTMGHAVGDSLLHQVAQRLVAGVGENVFVARMGGDEFALLFNSTDRTRAIDIAEILVTDLERTFTIDDGQINIGASIGLSFYPSDATNADQLQISSDFAMFYAKRERKMDCKSSIQLFNRAMADEFENRLRLEQDLSVAIEGNQLELFYQPQMNLNANKIDSVEALIRWNHPTRGVIPPDEFISIAEESGLMPVMGQWVIDQACAQAAEWNNESNLGLSVAVNVSVHQIMQPGFVPRVLAALRNNQLDARYLEIEITESVFMADTDWIIQSLLKLREAGIRVALDDFGTGYSSLSLLQDLPINTLKIDRSFVAKMDSSEGVSQSVTATIASIANVLGLATVAEGVESDFQLNQVADLGIDVVQGYFYSMPVSGDDILHAIEGLNGQSPEVRKAA